MPRKKKEETEEGIVSEKELVKEVEEQLLNEPETSQPEGKKLEEEAQAESIDVQEEKKLEGIKAELIAKAKKLKEKISGESGTEELKEKIKIKKRTDMLIPLEDYIKSGIYIGTRVVTPQMRQFVYRRRADGLAIFNTDLIDEKLREGIEYISKFDAKDIILVCKRQAGWKAAEKFAEITGIRVFTKKYPAGILTNSKLPNFFENELTIVCDSWLDRNALNDTMRVNKKILMICDTNNFPKGAHQITIGNNKSAKSLGVMFYLLARGFCQAKNMEKEIPELDWWMIEEEVVSPEERTRAREGARFGV
jgi:small subunit ribosomal protein S2